MAQMGCFPDRHQRHSIRLLEHDYSQPGAYFVTVCTLNRVEMFGDVVDNEMVLNGYGRIVGECWRWLSAQYPYVRLDEWVVMPNHLHGVLILGETGVQTSSEPAGKSLGRLVGAFKTISTKRINEARCKVGGLVWQRDFYDHILRGEQDLNRIREYIAGNPHRWAEDEENPCMWKKD